MHFEVIEMRRGMGRKYQGELSKDVAELLERFTQTVSLQLSLSEVLYWT